MSQGEALPIIDESLSQALKPTRIFYFTRQDYDSKKPVKVFDLTSQVNAPYNAPQFEKQAQNAANSSKPSVFLTLVSDGPLGGKMIQAYAPDRREPVAHWKDPPFARDTIVFTLSASQQLHDHLSLSQEQRHEASSIELKPVVSEYPLVLALRDESFELDGIRFYWAYRSSWRSKRLLLTLQRGVCDREAMAASRDVQEGLELAVVAINDGRCSDTRRGQDW